MKISTHEGVSPVSDEEAQAQFRAQIANTYSQVIQEDSARIASGMVVPGARFPKGNADTHPEVERVLANNECDRLEIEGLGKTLTPIPQKMQGSNPPYRSDEDLDRQIKRLQCQKRSILHGYDIAFGNQELIRLRQQNKRTGDIAAQSLQRLGTSLSR